MHAARLSPAVVLLILLAMVRCPGALADTASPPTAGQLPLFFIANQGQFDPQVKYSLQAGDRVFYFTSRGVTMVLGGPQASAPDRSRPEALPDWRGQASYWAARLEFTAANPLTVPRGRHPLPTTFSYFRGSPEQWRTAVSTCAEVVYEGLWPGVDLVFSAGRGQLKYTFIVHPGADPDRIRLAYRGAGISLTGEGQLKVDTPVGGLVDQAPLAWQDSTFSGRRTVPCSYDLMNSGDTGDQGYGFRVGGYDTTLPLILDPGFVVYSRLIGGGDDEAGYGIGLDSEGYAYITGYTTSPDFPLTVGPLLGGEATDVFVAKVRPDGSGLIYCGLLGGGQDDYGLAIAVDSEGNAFVTGYTYSTDFPHTVNVPLAGMSDVFVAKVRPDGSGLVYSRLLGGSDFDKGESIAVNSEGNAFVTGYTGSAGFPRTVGPPLHAGNYDAFVTKLDPDGLSPVYSRFIGGVSGDYGHGIAVDGAGNAFVTGSTYSADFPHTLFPLHAGGIDVFVAKVRPDGADLIYSRFLGGTGFDIGYGIAVNSAGNAFVTGYTGSDEFPRDPGSPGHAGYYDVFVAKVTPDGAALVYSRLLGGNLIDVGRGIAVDATGIASITGYTESADFPRTIGGPHAGGMDAFAARIRPDGSSLIYSGLLGGSANDGGYGITLDKAGDASITGYTFSAGFPRTVGPPYAGFADAFVAKIRPAFPWIIHYPAILRHGE